MEVNSLSFGAINIPTSKDNSVEGSEAFRITLNDGTGYALGRTVTLDGTLIDGTTPAKPTGLTATAGNGEVSLSWRDPDNDSITGYQLQRKKGSDSWSNWTDISNSDAATTSETVTGLDNGAEYSFRIRAKNTGINNGAKVDQFSPESDEAKATPMLPAPATPGVTISPKTLTVTEAMGAGHTKNYTVVLDTDPGATVTVTPVSSDVGAATVSAALTFDASNWDTAKSVTVTGVSDKDTADETVTVSHSVVGYGSGASAVTSADDVTVTVTDAGGSATAGVRVLPVRLALTEEGAKGKYTVVLNTAPSATATVTPSSSDTTKVTVTPEKLTFTSTDYNMAQTVTVTAEDDADIDDEPGITISHGVTGYGRLSSGETVTVDVTDNDEVAAPVLTAATPMTSQRMELFWRHDGTSAGDFASGATSFTRWEAEARLRGGNNWRRTPISSAGISDRSSGPMVTFEDNFPDGASLEVRVRAVGSDGSSAVEGPWSNIRTVIYRNTDTAALTITTTPLTVIEGAKATYTVALTKAYGGTLSITSANTDKATVSPGSLNFTTSNYSTAKTVTVTGVAEGSATINHAFRLAGASVDAIPDAGTVAVTVEEAITPGVTITPTLLTVNEGSSGKYTVVLDTMPSASVTVTVGGASGDLTVTGSPLRFSTSNWDTAQTVTVKAGSDEDTDDDSATLTHAASGTATGYNSSLSINTVSVTVTDTTPTLQLLTNPAAVSEGENISLTVTSDMDLTGDVTVNLTLADRGSSGFTAADIDGTLGPRDFTASFGNSPGKMGTVSITTNRDAVVESAENYRITLNDGPGYKPGSNTRADGTLNDGTISLSIADVSAAENGTFTFTVSASPMPSAPVTFKYKVTAEGSDTAIAGTDFTVVSTATAKTIAANVASTTITVSVTDDDLDEANETFTVTLSEPSTGVRLADATATGTITDDDSSPVLADIEDETIKLGQAVDITASATDGDSDTITYGWTRKVGETIPAVPGRPAFNQARLTFTPAATGTYTMTVTANDGNSNTDTEEVVITVNAKATVSVPSVLEVNEERADGRARVTITTTDAFDENVTFNVSYGGAATGAATLSAGDYENDAVTTVTFNASDTSKNIDVPLNNDKEDEDDETFTVSIAVSGGSLPAGYRFGNQTTTVTIKDDDNSPVLADIEDETIELGQAVDITATATDADSSDTITYAWTRKVGETIPALPGGTELNAAQLTFTPAAAGTYTMTVTASDGNGNEDTEEVVITITELPTAPGTPGVTITPTLLTVNEGSSDKYTVVLDTMPSASVTVTVGGASGDLTVTGSPLRFSTSNWDTAQTVTVKAGSDEDTDDDNATLTHTASGTATGYNSSLSINTVSVMVTDTTPTLQLLTNPAAVSEGENISLTVTSDMDLTGDVTVNLTLADRGSSGFTAADIDGTLGPRDFTASFGNSPGKMGTVSITTNRDAVVESAENYRITLNDGPGYKPGSNTGADGTLNDGTISLSIADVSAAENGTFTFTVSASPTPSAPVTFKYKVTAEGSDTAIAGTDFTVVSTATAKTIAANVASTTITVLVTDDDLDEANETFTMTLSEPSTGVRLADATATGTITDDDSSPVLADIEDETIKLGQAVDITASATDGDSDTITYGWTRKVGETIPAVPGRPAFNQARLTFTPAATGTYTMTVTANDGNSNTDTEEVVITVNAKATVSVPSVLEVNEERADGRARVTITTTDAFDENVTFNVSYGGTTATGAATLSAGDYENDAVTSVTFNASDTSKNIDVPLNNDKEDEDDETFTVSIAVSGGSLPAGYEFGNQTTTVTIKDDDNSPVLAEIANETIKLGQAVDITATATDADSSDTVTYAWTRKVGETNPALPGSLALNQARLTFTPAAAGTYTMTVTASDGNGNEDTEEVVITITELSVVSVPGTLMVTEGTDTQARVIITTTDAFGENVTFNVSYGDSGTATGAATLSAGDYKNDAVTSVTFNASDTSKNIDIPLNNDSIDEDDETIKVSIAVSGGSLPAGYEFGNQTTTVTIKDNDPMPSLSIAAPAAVTEGDSGSTDMVFAATLDAASGREVTVEYAVDTTSTATADTDFTNLSGTLTFTAGQTQKSITVAVTGDEMNESNETVVLKLSNPGNASIGTATASGTITDDDSMPSLSIADPAAVTEGDSSSTDMVFTVSLSSASGQQVTVDYAVDTTSTATSGTDFTALPSSTLTFTAGQTQKTITVAVTGDAVDEPDETVVLKLSNAGNASIGTATASGTITDDDSASSLSIADPTAVTEGNSGSADMVFTVTLSPASGQQVTVDYAVDNTSTSTADTDFTDLSGTLTFAASDTSKTITVAVTGDEVDEPDETVVLKLSNAVNASIGRATATGTITDDDGASSLSIAAPAAVTEGNSGTTNMVFTVTLAPASGQEVTVNYAVDAATTATSASDFTALPSGTLTFAAGDTSKTITVAVTGDAVDEPDETVVLKLSNAGNATIGIATATSTITDDDGEPSLSITAPATVTEGNSGSTDMVFTVTMSPASGQEVTVNYAVDATSTATSASDFTALPSGTLTFAAGDTSKMIRVAVTGDAVDEPDETVVLKLANASNATIGIATATGTITDDDGAPSLSITAPAAVTEGNSGSTNMVFTVTMSPASGQEVTVNYAVDATSTATSASDFTALPSGTLTFTAGDTSKTITVAVIGDELKEPNETVVLKLSSVSNASIGIAMASGTIIDDDGAPSLSITAPATVLEGDGSSTNMVFTVTLSPTSGQQVTVDYGVDATSTATSASDFTALPSDTLTFAAGDTSKTITVAVTGDAVDEPDETVVLKLANASNATIGIATATGIITDDDGAPSLSITVPAAVTEGDSGTTNMVFTVTLAPASGQQVTVDYAVDATSTATSTSDFTALPPGTLTFAVGDTSKTITVAVTGDAVDEPDETVVLKLSNASNASIGTATASGTITDDDGAPSLSITVPAAVTEGDSGTTNMVFTVTLAPASGQEVTVGYAVDTTSTATSASDFTALPPGTLTFAAGDTSKTITMVVTGDEVNEPNETVVLKLSNASNASIGIATATGTITDDDGAPSLSITAPTAVTEGDSGSINMVFTVTLAPASGQEVTVNYAVDTTSTATSASDFTELPPGTLTFAAGDTSKTITVAVTGDEVNEPNEMVVLKLVDAGNATIGIATATGTITDDDDEPSLSITAPAAVTEGDSGSTDMVFIVRLDASSGREVTVDYAVDATSTATADTDFTNLSGTLTFAAGDTSKTITVAVTGDEVNEPNETVVLNLSNAGNATIGTATATGTITDDDGAPSLSITAPAAVTEGDSGTTNMVFTVTLAPASGQQVTVNYAVDTTSTATSASDFTALPSSTLTFAAGDTSKTITVAVTGDEVEEPNETVVLRLANAGNATIGTATATGTITDDDGAPSLSITAPAAVMEGDSGTTNMVFTVTLAPASGQQVTVNYAVDTTSTATSASDFTALPSSTLTFAAGDTSKTITVAVTGDEVEEPNETVVLGLANAGNATISTATATGTITDDDNAPVLADIEDMTIRLSEAVAITASATDADSGDTITYAWVRKAGENTPALPQGTVLNAARLNFTPPAVGIYTMTVTVSDGNGNSDSQEVVITVGLPGVTINPTTLALTEGGSAGTYTVVLDTLPTATVTVTANSADTNAVTLSPAALSFSPSNWDTEQTVMVMARDDDDATDEEDVIITNTVTGANYDGVTAASVRVTVTDDESEDRRQTEVRKQELAGFSRTTMGIATDMIGARVGGDLSSGGASGSIGEQALGVMDNLLGDSTGSELATNPSLEQVGEQLWSQSFHISQSDSETAQQGGSVTGEQRGRWSLWGAGELRSFKGDDASDAEDHSYSGSIKAGWLGVDYQFTNPWLAGLAVSFSSAKSDYTYQSAEDDTGAGKTETQLTTFYPYGSVQLTERLKLWGTAGIGFGDLRHQSNDDDSEQDGELKVHLAAIGFDQKLSSLASWNIFSLAGDLAFVQSSTEWQDGALDDQSVSITRARLGVNSSFPLSETTRGYMTLRGRLDGGDLQMGAAEMVLGLRYSTGRFSTLLQGRQTYALDGTYSESGLLGELRFSSQQDGTGLALQLQPSYGPYGEVGGQQASLWDDQQLDAALTGWNGNGQPGGAMALKSTMGYGFLLPDSNVLLTPFAEMVFTEGSRRQIGLGLSMEEGPSWEVKLSGTREESSSTAPSGMVKLTFSKQL